jgi:prepilin-type processing-associated H-X9-DG protein
MTGANEFPPPVTNFLNATGLADLHSVTWSTSIAAGGFKHRLHAACPAPRRGLLRLLEQKPLDDADLKWLPRDATFAVVGNLDIPAAFDALKSGALALDAPADDIQSFMAKADEALGLKLREDFLAAFDDGIAMFDAPSQGGFFLTGMAWVFEVKDEAAIDRGMRACVNAIAKLLEREKIQITVKQAPIDGRDISFVTVPGKPFPFVPAWALHDKHLVIGLAPQTVALTLERISSSDAVARSLLGNEDFQRARRQLPEKLTQLAYADTQFAARRGYPFLLLGMSAALNAATGHGGEIDLATLPDARTFTGAMFADVSGIAVDDAGVSNVIHGPLPFPASGLLVANMSSTPLMISILLPSLSRARALSKRLVSVQNLRGIGVACMVYSQDHDGNFPPDLEALFTEGMLTSRKILVAPQAGGDEPSYTYLPGHRDGSDPRWVVAYEDYPDMDEEGANVLFMDGHVEFVKPLAHVHELVAATKEEMATHKKSEKSGEP